MDEEDLMDTELPDIRCPKCNENFEAWEAHDYKCILEYEMCTGCLGYCPSCGIDADGNCIMHKKETPAYCSRLEVGIEEDYMPCDQCVSCSHYSYTLTRKGKEVNFPWK